MPIPIVVCCAGKVAAPVAGLSDCEAALARGSMGNILRIQTYDFIDLYSVSVIALKCAISCYMGLRYNINLVISFMNVMPVLWHVPVCVWHAELVGYVTGGDRARVARVTIVKMATSSTLASVSTSPFTALPSCIQVLMIYRIDEGHAWEYRRSISYSSVKYPLHRPPKQCASCDDGCT